MNPYESGVHIERRRGQRAYNYAVVDRREGYVVVGQTDSLRGARVMRAEYLRAHPTGERTLLR